MFLTCHLPSLQLSSSSSHTSPSPTMAHPPPPFPASPRELNLTSITAVIAVIDHHFHRFLSSPATRRSLQLCCTAKLAIPSSGCFEFSDHSILSNLYWGIETIESAINADSAGDQNALLANSEKMLQVPAMLDEDAATAGIDNKYIVCCSYFHLALIRKLSGDEWQMAMHFLQAVLVSPSCVGAQLAPELCVSLFGSPATNGGSEEAVRRWARRYKDCLMYYQVISYGESRNNQFKCFSSTRFLESVEKGPASAIFQGVNKAKPFDPISNIGRKNTMASASHSVEYESSSKLGDGRAAFIHFDECFDTSNKDIFDIRRLQEMLEESQSESFVSMRSDSTEASDSEATIQNKESPGNGILVNEDLSASDMIYRNCLLPNMSTVTCEAKSPINDILEENETNASHLLVNKADSSRKDLNFSTLDNKDVDSKSHNNFQKEEENSSRASPRHDIRCFSSFSSKFRKKYSFSELIHHGSFARKKIIFSSSEKDWSEDSSNYEKDTHIQLLQGFEKMISALCTSKGSRNCENVDWELTTMWELLHNKTELKCNSAKQEILDQLLKILSSSKREREIRVSVSILLVLISEDKTIIEDIKRKNFHLYNLATALKRNVHEAAILIYLLNPSPLEIRSLELLPALVEVACNPNRQKQGMMSLPLTPSSASIAMIEILVTAFDYVTNNMHLAAISSPKVLTKLVNVAMNNNIDEGVALATILMRCMRLNGNCRKFLSQVTSVDPFIQLLQSNIRSAKSATLEYFHELLCIPRSSAIRLLHQIRQVGRTSIMTTLLTCVKQAKNENQLLAANLLLQLDMLGGTKRRSEFREEAIEALLESAAIGENPNMQSLSAFILSNLGGTFSWTGESYTAAWLVKKAGLTTACHRNMVRDIDWLDPCLQGSEMHAWSRMAAEVLTTSGRSLFCTIAKGLQSQRQSVQRDCLITSAWIGSELAVAQSRSIRYFACEILLDEVAAFLHPGIQLDERVLACLSVYNYTAGKGKQKLLNFSEGLRESLRRLSGVTWMAEELLNVTDYVLPTKSRVSCVHTQILEIANNGNGSATALIFYKGYLYTGYSDGSIKVWDIKGQRSVCLWEVMKHKRSVTSFSIYEAGDSLLSGSADKTVRVWKMVQRKLECIEVIQVKEPVQKLGTCKEKILIVTPSHGLKVCHASKSIQTICKKKHITSFAVFEGKIYVGCRDSSMQEIDAEEDNEIEIRAPKHSWKIQKRPINAICVFKGWVYCAGATVEGSSAKDWRRRKQPQMSTKMSRGNNAQAMTLAEDFLYLNCSSSPSTVQICLREKQQSVGRLSAGSKVTSLLTANDIILCGTEDGLVKGWIPLSQANDSIQV